MKKANEPNKWRSRENWKGTKQKRKRKEEQKKKWKHYSEKYLATLWFVCSFFERFFFSSSLFWYQWICSLNIEQCSIEKRKTSQKIRWLNWCVVRNIISASEKGVRWRTKAFLLFQKKKEERKIGIKRKQMNRNWKQSGRQADGRLLCECGFLKQSLAVVAVKCRSKAKKEFVADK